MVAILEETFRDEWSGVLATLIGFLGDFELAEEATQEAFAIAAERWPRDGIPNSPVAADPVDRPVASRRDEPCDRVGGRAVARPALGGDRERLLGGLLGKLKVAEEADQ